MTGLIATKVGMSRVFQDDGAAVPVTYLKIDPNTIVRTKTQEKDGYNAMVLGIGAKKWKSRKGKENTRYSQQKEWKLDSVEGVSAGKEVAIEILPKDTTVTICGISKGRGFQGVIKRYGFSMGPNTHGSHHHRRTGSIGMCAYPGRVIKGKKMPGRMGNDQITLHGREVLLSDADKGVIAVKGPVPGPNGASVFITVEEWPEGYEPAADAAPASDSASDEATPDKEEKVEEKVEEAPKEEPKKESDSASDEATPDKEAPKEESKEASASAEATADKKEEKAESDSKSESESKS